MFSSSLPEFSSSLPEDQDWLCERMQKLGYLDDDGCCNGVARMGAQAIIANQTDIFDKRLEIIHSIPLDDFNKAIDLLQQKRVAMLEEIKRSILAGITEEETERLLNDPKVKNKLTKLIEIVNQLVQEGKVENGDKEYENRKIQLLFNTWLQEKIESKMKSLLEEESIALDIPAFLDGLNLYQNPEHYPACFEEKARKQVGSQDASFVLPLVIPQTLEEKGGIISSESLSGVGQVDKLSAYFTSFRDLVKKYQLHAPIAFVLQGSDHAMTVGFNPLREEWLFINANRMPTQYIKDVNVLAEIIIYDFFLPDDGSAIFNTTIYANKADEALLKECLTDWKNHPAWRAVHTSYHENAHVADEDNATWLYIAAENGHILEVQALIAAGADPERAKTNGVTPLYGAAQNGHLNVVQALLAAGADPNQAQTDGVTPLYVAAQYGYPEVVQALLKAGANPNQAITNGATPLYMAAQNGHLEIVQALLAAGAGSNQAHTDGATPLYGAAQNGHLNVVQALLVAGANPNQTRTDGVTPLYMAAQNGYPEVAQALLKAGANPNQAITNGLTPLYMAVQNGYPDVVQVLLKAGAIHPRSAGLDDITPLSLAIKKNHFDIAKLLLLSNRVNPALAMNIPIKKLREFAKKEGAWAAVQMEAFILNNMRKKNSTPRFKFYSHDNVITIRAGDIARIILHKPNKFLEKPKKIPRA